MSSKTPYQGRSRIADNLLAQALIACRYAVWLHRLLGKDFDIAGIVANPRGQPNRKMDIGKWDLMHVADAIARRDIVVGPNGDILGAARWEIGDGRRAAGEHRFLVLVENFHTHLDGFDRTGGDVLDREGDHRRAALALLGPIGLESGELPSPGARDVRLCAGGTC